MLGFIKGSEGKAWPTGGEHGGPEEPGSLPSTCWSGAARRVYATGSGASGNATAGNATAGNT